MEATKETNLETLNDDWDNYVVLFTPLQGWLKWPKDEYYDPSLVEVTDPVWVRPADWPTGITKKNIDTTKSDDDIEKHANIHIMYRPLDGWQKWLSYFQSLTHWAVFVDFDDGRNFILELEKDKLTCKNGSSLTSGFSPDVDAPNWQFFPSSDETMSVLVSPKKLLEIARAVPIHGQSYNPLNRNCQIWCKEFCGQQLSKELEEEVKELPDVKQSILNFLWSLIGM